MKYLSIGTLAFCFAAMGCALQPVDEGEGVYDYDYEQQSQELDQADLLPGEPDPAADDRRPDEQVDEETGIRCSDPDKNPTPDPWMVVVPSGSNPTPDPWNTSGTNTSSGTGTGTGSGTQDSEPDQGKQHGLGSSN